jgi:ethanolamine-phosphate cytidylyltransferase
MPAHEDVPSPGHWPVDPQEDMPVTKARIWVDGCFDFAHHGHAGAMLQARQLGTSLLVGIHSDEAILENKGPTVMTLKERVSAVDACRWASKSIPHAPYVTSLPWISHYGCHYVVHGDDITSDSNGEDCYRYVKAAGRFLVVKRTPGISTTDLVGRMLLCTRNHFIKNFSNVLEGTEGHGTAEEKKALGKEMMQRIRDYATDETGLAPGAEVYSWTPPHSVNNIAPTGAFSILVEGRKPRPGQRIVYVDGGFDLFSSGHIAFLRKVWEAEKAVRPDDEPFVIAGVHDDEIINKWKGINYPIMNIFERGLCVLQCKVCSRNYPLSCSTDPHSTSTWSYSPLHLFHRNNT